MKRMLTVESKHKKKMLKAPKPQEVKYMHFNHENVDGSSKIKTSRDPTLEDFFADKFKTLDCMGEPVSLLYNKK